MKDNLQTAFIYQDTAITNIFSFSKCFLYRDCKPSAKRLDGYLLLHVELHAIDKKISTMISFEHHHSITCIDSEYTDLVHVGQFGDNQHDHCKCVEEKHRMLVISCV